MALSERIAVALSGLVGLPVCAAARAGGMATLQFGECRQDDRDRVTGTYALHLQCAWRLLAQRGVLVGSGDFFYPADEALDWSEFDPDQHVSRYSARLSAWIASTPAEDRTVVAVAGSDAGDLTIRFAGGAFLEGFAVDSLKGDDSERWRLFRPGTEQHFVVYAESSEDA